MTVVTRKFPGDPTRERANTPPVRAAHAAVHTCAFSSGSRRRTGRAAWQPLSDGLARTALPGDSLDVLQSARADPTLGPPWRSAPDHV